MASPAIISRSTCRRLRPSGNRLRLISQGTPCSSGSSWVLLHGVWRRARLPASLYRRAASRRDARRAGAGRRDRLAAIIGNAQAQQRMTQVQRIDGWRSRARSSSPPSNSAYRWAAMPPREEDCRPTIGGLHRGQSFHRVSILIQPTRLQEYIQMLIGMKIIII